MIKFSQIHLTIFENGHIYMLICANKNEPNALHIFQCEYCDFKCSKNSDYGRLSLKDDLIRFGIKL